MKKFIIQSQRRSGSFYQEGFVWQGLRKSALIYYGVNHLYYKEDRADDFLIDAMLRLVGSIDLSLYPNSNPVLNMKCKNSETIQLDCQMNMEFQSRKFVG